MAAPNTYFIAERDPPELVYDTLVEALETTQLRRLDRSDIVAGKSGAKGKRSPKIARVGFFWIDAVNGRYPKEYYHVQCFLKNVLGDGKHIISKKDSLMREFTRAGVVQYIGESYELPLADVGFAQPGQVFIFKPINSFSGVGITIERAPFTKERINEIVATIKEEVRTKLGFRTEVIMSRYCTNPLLFSGRKCHFRAYYMLVYYRGALRAYMHNRGKIIMAAKPYTNDNFGDPDIHDTHFKSTNIDLMFPDDLALGGISADIYAKAELKMREALAAATNICRPRINLHSETEHAFEVFGVDFLVHDDGNVWLLEINDKVGYKANTGEFLKKQSDAFFKWINECVIAPIFMGTDFPPALA